MYKIEMSDIVQQVISNQACNKCALEATYTLNTRIVLTGIIALGLITLNR